VCLVFLALPSFGQSSDPADWPREIIEGWIMLVDQQAEHANVVNLINFEQGCKDWQLNYRVSRDKEAYEAEHPIPVPPNRVVRGEVPVDPRMGTYLIPFPVVTSVPIAAACEKPSRPVDPEDSYGFGPPVDSANPGGNLLIRHPTNIAAGSIRQNPENGRNYRLVVRSYGNFVAKWWEPVAAGSISSSYVQPEMFVTFDSADGWVVLETQ